VENIPTEKRAGGVVQVVEHLPNKHKALSSNPTTKKITKQKQHKKPNLKQNLIFIPNNTSW
jgi:hypothetical protein